MASLNGFNANNVKPNDGFELLPAGDYIAIIASSDVKQNSAGTGEYLSLEIHIIDGEYKGRKLWENLNLKHPDTKTVQIAQGTLSAICRAVKVMEPKDSADLHNIPMLIKVGLRKRKDTGEDQNRITSWKPKDGSSAAPVTVASGDKSSKPWERKA